MQRLSLPAGLGIAGFLLAVVGWLMPWVDHVFPGGTASINGDEIEGYRLLVLAIPGAACLWLTTIKRLQMIMSSAATMLAATICLIGFIRIGEISGAPDDPDASLFVGEQLIGSKIMMFGAFVALGGSCALMLVSLRKRTERLAANPAIAHNPVA
jgi:hypothetical protein